MANQKEKKSIAKASYYLDTRRKKENDTYPLKLRISFSSQKKLYRTPYELTIEEFTKVTTAKRLPDHLKVIQNKLDKYLAGATKALDSLSKFTFASFELTFFESSTSVENVFTYFDMKYNENMKRNAAGNAEFYLSTANSLKKYLSATGSESDYLALQSITPAFITDWQTYMQVYGNNGKGQSTNGLMIYIRTLRAVIKHCIAIGVMAVENYPFHVKGINDLGFKIKSSTTKKRPLTEEQLKQLIAEPKQSEFEIRALDFFLLSFDWNGMNIADIARLRWEQIQGNTIRYNRKKTAGKLNEAIEIEVNITSFARSIIDRYAVSSGSFVFGIISDNMTEANRVRAIKNFTGSVNKPLKRIAKRAGLPEAVKLSSYYARHSFTSIATKKNQNLAAISQQLGHADIRTTQIYIDSFSSEEVKQLQSATSGFLSEKLAG